MVANAVSVQIGGYNALVRYGNPYAAPKHDLSAMELTAMTLSQTLMRCIIDYDRMSSGRDGWDPKALVDNFDRLANTEELLRSGTNPIAAIETAFPAGELRHRLIALARVSMALAPSPLTCDDV